MRSFLFGLCLRLVILVLNSKDMAGSGDLDRNIRLELPETSAEGLQTVIAEAAETRAALRELVGSELRTLAPHEAEVAQRLAIKEAVIIWVLDKVLPPQILGGSWDRRVEAEMSGPLGLHMTREEILDHLRFESDAQRYIFDRGDEPFSGESEAD